MRKQIQQFYFFAGFDEGENMLAELPVTLRLQLDLVLNRNLFLKARRPSFPPKTHASRTPHAPQPPARAQVPFFKNCDMSQITVIVPRIHREYAWPGKTILHEGVEGRGLFMIGRGFVKITVQGQLKELLAHPDFFGEQTLVTDHPAAATGTTVTLCQFMVLEKGQFEDVLELYPNLKKTIGKYVRQSTMEIKGGAGLGVRTNLTNVKLELRQNRHLLSAAGYAHVLDEIAVFELLLKASKDGDGRKTRSKSVFVKPGARGSRRVGASESTRNTEPDIAALTEGVVPG